MAEEMLNELLGDFTEISDETQRVQQKRSDSAFSADLLLVKALMKPTATVITF